MDFTKPPAQWSIDGGDGSIPPRLRIGAQSWPLAHVERATLNDHFDVNATGHMIIVGLFMGLGTFFLLLVANGADPKFLVGAVLFIGLGLMVLADTLRGHYVTVHRVVLDLAGGEQVAFTSVDPKQCEALLATVQQAGASRR